MIVDYQTHLMPNVALRARVGRDSYPRTDKRGDDWFIELSPAMGRPLGQSFVDPLEQLRAADENGIDVLVTSPNMLGEVWDLG